MEKPSYKIIANWKMYFTFDQVLAWVRIAKDELEQATKKSGNIVILCPSFESLYPIAQKLASSSIFLGAQDCSNHTQGAYTGQVQARSLAEIGCTYCIVGHSERRTYQQEKSDEIAQKVALLLENKIRPVLCIGESKQAYDDKKTEIIIQQQLEPIRKILYADQSEVPFYIAYEPIWAIGTGITPENSYLEKIFSIIKNIIEQWPNKNTIHLLYGGSVNTQTSVIIKNVSAIEGFLIGKASTDFQELKNMLLLL